MSEKLVIGNWKMHLRQASAQALVMQLMQDENVNRSWVGIAAPFVYLAALKPLLQDSAIQLAAQDTSAYQKDGAYTGEISAAMLADVGCRYVLIGHSERRQYFQEDNALLLRKMQNGLEAGLIPVLCVGETLAQREAGHYLETIYEQLALLTEFTPESQYVIAYEPVWAIGTGKVATIEQIDEIHSAIKKWCLQKVSSSDNIRVLYGGSVKAENAEAILALKHVDGALVGGASLDAQAFGAICQAAGKMI